MILRQPGRIAADQIYTEPMGTVDLTPTVMGLLGLPANADDQGRDLSATLSDVAKTETDEADPPVTFLRNAGVVAAWLAAVDARYKLIVSVNDVPWLFDAKEDPDELVNFHGKPEYQAVEKRLAAKLLAYGQKNKDPHIANEKIAASLQDILAK